MRFGIGAVLVALAASGLSGCNETEAVPNPGDFLHFIVAGERQLSVRSCTVLVRPVGDPHAPTEKLEYFRHSVDRSESYEFVTCKRSRVGEIIAVRMRSG